jgi:hypothetical protein
LEGEDDELIWQKAVRASQGTIKLYPVSVDTITQLKNYETEAADIMQAVYDNARGFSLRDGDCKTEDICDLGCIIRMRLQCRSAENLMLTDDVLQNAGTHWENLLTKINSFIRSEGDHPKLVKLRQFVSDGAQRRTADLKEIRLLISGFFTNKPWEVIVGQSIARLAQGEQRFGPDTLVAYLGEKACRHLLGIHFQDTATSDQTSALAI